MTDNPSEHEDRPLNRPIQSHPDTSKAPTVALFLGAGASAFANYSTFQTFPALMFNKRVRAREGLGSLSDDTLKLLKNIERYLVLVKKPLTHDNFMWVLDGYTAFLQQLRRDGGLRSRFRSDTLSESEFNSFDTIVKDAIREMSRTTVRHYSRRLVKNAEPDLLERMSGVFGFYQSLARENDPQTPFLQVFTANYDMLVEDLFEHFASSSSNHVSLTHGFNRPVPSDGSLWNKDLYGNPTSLANGICYYRIHGCVCWYWRGLGDNHVYFRRDISPLDDTENVCAMFPGKEIYRGFDPHAFAFHHLYQALLSYTAIVFIGFSFRDGDVLQLLLTANGQRQNPLKIIIVNSVTTQDEVQGNFMNAESNNHFPGRCPNSTDIYFIKKSFGMDEHFVKQGPRVKDVIYEDIHRFLNGEG